MSNKGEKISFINSAVSTVNVVDVKDLHIPKSAQDILNDSIVYISEEIAEYRNDDIDEITNILLATVSNNLKYIAVYEKLHTKNGETHDGIYIIDMDSKKLIHGDESFDINRQVFDIAMNDNVLKVIFNVQGPDEDFDTGVVEYDINDPNNIQSKQINQINNYIKNGLFIDDNFNGIDFIINSEEKLIIAVNNKNLIIDDHDDISAFDISSVGIIAFSGRKTDKGVIKLKRGRVEHGFIEFVDLESGKDLQTDYNINYSSNIQFLSDGTLFVETEIGIDYFTLKKGVKAAKKINDKIIYYN